MSKMRPGPELDNLIVEKVLEWKKIHFDVPKTIHEITWMWEPLEGALASQVQTAPRYSTDISLAMQLLTRNHDYADLRWNTFENKWTCYLKCPKHNMAFGCEADGETACHAICLAVLRSIGVIIEAEVKDGFDR